MTQIVDSGAGGGICRHCEALRTYCYYSLPTGTPRKTQIQADILRLRRELLDE